MGITERLANLPIYIVLIAVAVLLVARFLLLRRPSKLAKSFGEAAESLAIALGLVFLIIRPFVVQAFFIPSPSMRPTLIENDHIMVNKFIYRFRQPARGDVVVFKSPPAAMKSEAEFIKRVIAVPRDVVHITEGYVTIGGERKYHAALREQLSRYRDEGRVKLVGDSKVYVDGKRMPLSVVAEKFGKPGEPVEVLTGRVYVNGKPIGEPYTAEDPDVPYPVGLDEVETRWIVTDKEGARAVRIPEGKLLVMGDNRNKSNDARMWGLLDRNRVLGKAMFVFWPPGRMRWIR